MTTTTKENTKNFTIPVLYGVFQSHLPRFRLNVARLVVFCSLEMEKSTDLIDFTHFRTNIVGMNTFHHFFPIHILSPITEMQCTYIYNSFVHSFAPLSSHTTSYFSLMVFRSFSIIFRYPSLSSFSLSSSIVC